MAHVRGSGAAATSNETKQLYNNLDGLASHSLPTTPFPQLLHTRPAPRKNTLEQILYTLDAIPLTQPLPSKHSL